MAGLRSIAQVGPFGRLQVGELSVAMADDSTAVAYVVENMRADDAHEWLCVGADPANANLGVLGGDDTWLARIGDEPVFVWGTRQASPMLPHVRGLFGFGTDKTRRVIPFLTRWGKSWWMPHAFNDLGTSRVEVRVPRTCENSIKWLIGLGMRVETSITGMSLNEEPHVQLAFTRSDWERKYVLSTDAGHQAGRGANGAREVFAG